MSTESDSYASEIGFHRGTSNDNDRGLFLSGDGSTKHVRVLHGGNVGIGTASPDQTLHVWKGDAGGVASSSASVLTLENNDHAILQFLTPNDKYQEIRFGDVQDNGNGWFAYNHDTLKMQWGTNGPVKMTLDSSGNLGIGDTDPSGKLEVKVTQGYSGSIVSSSSSDNWQGKYQVLQCTTFWLQLTLGTMYVT